MLLKEMNKTKIAQLELIELSTSFNCRNKYSIDRLSCLELIVELINEQASVIDTVTAQIFSKSQHQCIKALEYDAGSVTNRRALMNKYVLLYTEALNKHAEQIDRIRHKLEIKSIIE
ncbi:MAG: hypothetical protein VX777_04895 [Chlamydiota bacterium]|nr:hypothetical protein [Chlamydiota bacterium]